MTMKQILLATTALAAASFAAMPAFADGGNPPPSHEKPTPPAPPPQPPEPPMAPQPPKEMRGGYSDCLGGSVCEGGKGSGFYISVLGGGNWSDDHRNDRFALNSGTSPEAFYSYQAYKPDTGFVVGGAVGYDLCCWLPGLRGELELTYRRTSIKKGYHEDGTDTANSSSKSSDNSGPFTGHISSFALMANVWYDFDLGGINPYIGGGIGWAQNRFNADYFSGTFSSPLGAVDETDTGFAYQLGAGFNVPVSQGVRLGLGYRFVDLGKLEFEMPNPWVAPLVSHVSFDQQQHSAVVNLTFDID